MRSLTICTTHQILSGDQIKKKEIGGERSLYGERRGVHRVLVEKLERKRPLGKSRRRSDNIKMDLQEVGWGMGCIDLTQNREG